MRYLENTAIDLNDILKRNDLTLINSFEDKFIKLESSLETSNSIIYLNRELIRNAYVATILLYNEDSDIRKFRELLHKEIGCIEITHLSKKKFKESTLNKKVDEVVYYFLNEYYNSCKLGVNKEIYIPTIYLVNKMVDLLNIKEGLFSDLEEDNGSKNKYIFDNDKNYLENESLKITEYYI